MALHGFFRWSMELHEEVSPFFDFLQTLSIHRHYTAHELQRASGYMMWLSLAERGKI